MKTVLIFSLSFVIFACHDGKKSDDAELEETNLTEKSTIGFEKFSDLLNMEPNKKVFLIII